MLKVTDLTKSYHHKVVVDQLNFELGAGEILGLIGPNGAGKSTTIAMLATLSLPSQGTIYYNGIDVVTSPKAIQRDLGLVPQEIALYERLSVMDNMMFWGRAYGLKRDLLRDRIGEVAKLVGIESRLDQTVATLSGGLKRRLNIGVALLHKPKLLLLDEPTVGIDPQSRHKILEALRQLKSEGMSIIYSSHYFEEVTYLCDRLLIMDRGKLLMAGTLEEMYERVPLDAQQNDLEALYFYLTGMEEA